MQRHRVAVLEALEEQVARGAELVPDRVRLALLHRADRLPVDLQPLDARRRLLPLGRLRQLLRLGDQRFLALEVLGPVLLALLEIVLAAREELVARGAEALPHRLLVAARDRRRSAFHSACSVFMASAVFTQSVESAIDSARSAQRFLLLQVLDALGRLLREEVLALVVDLLLRGLEARPQRLGLRARRGGHRLPPLLQRAHLVRGLFGIGLGERDERFHLGAQLFLHLDVRPALPLLRFAQLLDARRQRRAHGLQAHHQVFAILLVGQRAHRADRQLHVLQQLIGLLEREAFGRRRGSRTSAPAPAAAAGSRSAAAPLASRCVCSCASSFCAAAS